jgi:hypothetical protein
MERAASNYRDGEVRFETAAKYVTSELAYAVEMERVPFTGTLVTGLSTRWMVIRCAA